MSNILFRSNSRSNQEELKHNVDTLLRQNLQKLVDSQCTFDAQLSWSPHDLQSNALALDEAEKKMRQTITDLLSRSSTVSSRIVSHQSSNAFDQFREFGMLLQSLHSNLKVTQLVNVVLRHNLTMASKLNLMRDKLNDCNERIAFMQADVDDHAYYLRLLQSTAVTKEEVRGYVRDSAKDLKQLIEGDCDRHQHPKEKRNGLARYIQPHGFTFKATLVCSFKRDDQGLQMVHCRALMDTGAQDSWISSALIASTHYENELEDFTDPRAYRAFGGQVFFPIGKVRIRWYLEDENHSRWSYFLVGDGVPFDMVVGSELIQQEELLLRKEAALGVRVIEPTADELAKMEQDANTGARSRRELEAIRQARQTQAAKEREQERERMHNAAALTIPTVEVSTQTPLTTTSTDESTVTTSTP